MADITPVALRPVPEVVEALEEALEEARAGRLRDVAIVARVSSGHMNFSTWGLEDNVWLVGMLERVKHRLLADIERFHNGEHDHE